jgi:hypothetical protein
VVDPRATNLIQTILHGGSVPTDEGRALLTGFAKACSDARIAASSGFVVAQFGGQTGKASAKTVVEARRQ